MTWFISKPTSAVNSDTPQFSIVTELKPRAHQDATNPSTHAA
jgi:hypothetical protein